MKILNIIKKINFKLPFLKPAYLAQKTELNLNAFSENELDCLLQEFVFLTEADEFNEPKIVEQFISNTKFIKNNLNDYFKLLIDEGCEDEVLTFNEAEHFQFVLSTLLYTYEDDWTKNYQSLSDYITNEIGQEFTILPEQIKNRTELIVNKLENESDYTLLDISSSTQNNSFFVCLKNRKNKIVALAKQLNFPIKIIN